MMVYVAVRKLVVSYKLMIIYIYDLITVYSIYLY